MNAKYFQLYTQTKLGCARLRLDARSDRKDEAREFIKFTRNGCIIEILTDHEFPNGYLVNVPLLSWELVQLEKETDGMIPKGVSSDLAAIRISLDILAATIVQLLPSKASAAKV